MKSLIAALIATLFATAAFAQTPVAEVKADAKVAKTVDAKADVAAAKPDAKVTKAKAKSKAKHKHAAAEVTAAVPATPAK